MAAGTGCEVGFAAVVAVLEGRNLAVTTTAPAHSGARDTHMAPALATCVPVLSTQLSPHTAVAYGTLQARPAHSALVYRLLRV